MFIIKQRREGDDRPWDKISTHSKVTSEFGLSHALYIAAHMCSWPKVQETAVADENDPLELFIIQRVTQG